MEQGLEKKETGDQSPKEIGRQAPPALESTPLAQSGIVFDIKRGVAKDGPGLRTSVFLKGCPLRCAWCHNPESQLPEPEMAVTTGEICGREMTVDAVISEVRRDAVFYSASGGGLTITGGEPLAQPDFAYALATATKAYGIHVALDTSGFARWEVVEKVAARVDLFLYDIKCMDCERHRALTGVGNEIILDNLRRLDAAGAHTWVRCPLVPGLNDSDADIAAIRDLVSGLRNCERVDLLPYHPLGLSKYAKFGKIPPLERHSEPSNADIARWNAVLRSGIAASES